MATLKDIQLSARLIMKEHGADAVAYAMTKVAEFERKNDEEAASVWLAITVSIKALTDLPSSKLH